MATSVIPFLALPEDPGSDSTVPNPLLVSHIHCHPFALKGWDRDWDASCVYLCAHTSVSCVVDLGMSSIESLRE